MTNVTSRPGAIPLPDDDDLLFEQLLAESGAERSGASAMVAPRGADVRVPLTFAQELIWLLDQASPGLTAYNVPVARRISGSLDVAALERALGTVSARHEVLRTRFGLVGGEPTQLIDPAAPVALRVVDLSATADADRIAAAKSALESRARTPFAMEHEHLFRATLVRLAESDHVLLIETHHAVCDGWSVGVLFQDLVACYAAERRGGVPQLPPLRVQYGDVALWEREQLSGARLAELVRFWKAHVAGAEAPLELPTDFAPSSDVSFAGARRSRVLAPEAVDAIDAFGRRHGATRYMVLLAAYATVMHRYTGAEQVLIGSANAGRTLHETEPLIGYFSNTMVQRADFGGDPTFAELVERVRDRALAVYDHQELPLEKLMLELRRDSGRNFDAPLFRVVFTMQDTGAAPVDLDGAQVTPFGVELGATKFDLTLLTSERADGLLLSARYRSDLFVPATVDRFLGHLCQVLEHGVRDTTARISALPLLRLDERTQLASWNATSDDSLPTEPVHVRVASIAARTPDAVALVGDRSRLTYGELDARANRIANALCARGVVRGDAVGLHLDRSVGAVAALLGILKCGCAYVPLGRSIPVVRLRRQLDDSGARIVVTDRAHAGTLPDGVSTMILESDEVEAASAAPPEVAVSSADDLAYVLFTSGSTGAPKGVAVTHGNIANYTAGIFARLGICAEDATAFATAAPLTADLGNTAIFPALTSGGVLHVLSDEVATNAERLAEYFRVAPVDVLKITPNHLQALIGDRTLDAAAPLLPRRWLVLGGESLSWDLALRVLGMRRCRVMNHYGPTEATVGATTFEITEASADEARALGARTVPVGAPLPNVVVSVLDSHGEELPIGAAGELVIAGRGVARGYAGRPDLTAERFVPLADGQRAYRTGDRVRRLATGDVEHLGRLDGQVKVRGFRVELGEIESVLAEHASVARAAAFARDDAVAAAVVLRREAASPAPAGLREFAAVRLPEYMVPTSIAVVDALPLSPTGKLDRVALATVALTHAGAPPAAGRMAPRSEMEQSLLQIWAEVLKRDPAELGVADNFLALGGHSLAGIRILGKLSRQFGVRLPLRVLFEAPTIESLAELVGIERELAALDAQAETKSP